MFQKSARTEIKRIENDIEDLTILRNRQREIIDFLEDSEIERIWDEDGSVGRMAKAMEYQLYKVGKKKNKILKSLMSNDLEYFDVYLEDLIGVMQQTLINQGIMNSDDVEKFLVMRKVNQCEAKDESGKTIPHLYDITYEYGFENSDPEHRFCCLLPVITERTENPTLSPIDFYKSADKSKVNILEMGLLTDNTGNFCNYYWQDAFMNMVRQNISDALSSTEKNNFKFKRDYFDTIDR